MPPRPCKIQYNRRSFGADLEARPSFSLLPFTSARDERLSFARSYRARLDTLGFPSKVHLFQPKIIAELLSAAYTLSFLIPPATL